MSKLLILCCYIKCYGLLYLNNHIKCSVIHFQAFHIVKKTDSSCWELNLVNTLDYVTYFCQVIFYCIWSRLKSLTCLLMFLSTFISTCKAFSYIICQTNTNKAVDPLAIVQDGTRDYETWTKHTGTMLWSSWKLSLICIQPSQLLDEVLWL